MATLEGADADFAQRVNNFIGSRKGVGLTSGKRSRENQQGLWDAAVKKYGSPQAARKWVAPPGDSNHEHGTAADLSGIEGVSDEELAQFGLHRPMPWEPWHVEPIGKGNPKGHTPPRAPANMKIASIMNNFEQALSTIGTEAAPVTAGAAPTASGTTDPAAGAVDAVAATGVPGTFPQKPEDPIDIDVHTVDSGIARAGGPVKTNASVNGLNGEQVANAATIIQIGRQRGLSDRAIQLAIATAIVESGIRNVNHGDRDSLGLFQQRPSQGWGTPAQVTDPAYATNKFYDTLLKVKGWESMPFTKAAQAVQRSAFPDKYGKQEGLANEILRALAG